MKIETTNQALLRQMEMRKINQCAIPAVYPTVVEKYISPSKDKVRIVEAISRNRDYNECMDRKAEAVRRESSHLYTFVGSLSTYLEVGSLIDTQT